MLSFDDQDEDLLSITKKMIKNEAAVHKIVKLQMFNSQSKKIENNQLSPTVNQYYQNCVQLKYVSKEEREQQKQKEEQDLKKKKEEEIKKVKDIRRNYDKYRCKLIFNITNTDKDWKRNQEKLERDIQRKKNYEEQEKKSKSKSRSRSRNKSHSQSRVKQPIENDKKKLEADQQQQSIKEQYLCLRKEVRKFVKPSEKFKNIFNFEWSAKDDTSTDYNTLYSNRLKENLLFGRGTKAGYDRPLDNKSQIQEDQQMNSRSNSQEIAKLPKKNVYDIGQGDHWRTKASKDMMERDWRIFREDNDIIIKGGKVPKPIREWEEHQGIPSFTQESLKNLNYSKPTPIQMQAIPIGLARKDMIGIAPTGSGKSAAYIIPLIIYLKTLKPINYDTAKDGPYSLILLPSRELAPQVEREFNSLAKDLKLKAFVCVGGRQQEEQMFILQQGCELLIGTPGRIKEAIEKQYLVLDQCSWVILDEADKMIDMGFEEDVNYILDSIKSQMKSEDENIAEQQESLAVTGEKIFRVTHLFSATMPPEIEILAKKYLRAFCFISIGEPGGGKKDIEQRVEYVGENEKRSKLRHVLSKNNQPPIIIFVNEKKNVDSLAKAVEQWGWNCVVYHGSRSQVQREQAVDGFKSRKYDILIATDLGGRGLHVEGVKLVVNYDAPKNIRDFVHRTGRTGRAGKKGLAYTFITNNDEALFYDLKEFLLKNDQPIPEALDQHAASKMRPGIVELVPRRKQIVFAQ